MVKTGGSAESNSLLWKEYKISDIGSFYSGLTGKSKADFGTGNGRYITFLNVLYNTVIDTSILEKVRMSETEAQNLVAKGDLFFNTSSETPEEVGMCSTLTEDLDNTYLNSFCFGFRITDPEIYSLYLSYYFNSQEGRKIMRVLAQGATRYNLSKSYFGDTVIMIPQKSEQIAIATALSDIDNLIANLEKLIAKKKFMKQGAMQELLTGRRRLPGYTKSWVKLQLSKLCSKLEMGQSPDSKYYSASEGIPLVQGNADLDNRHTVARIFTTNVTKEAAKGDIIFTVRAPVGNVARASFNCCIGRGVCALKGGTDFLFHLLIYFENSWSAVASGSTFDSINSETLINTLFYVPSDHEEQKAIAQILSDMDSEIEELEKKSEEYKNIKAGMMSELFTGHIRLTDKEEA